MISAVVAKPGFSLSLDDEQKLFSIIGKFDTLLVSEDMGGSYFTSRSEFISECSIISVGCIEEKRYPFRFDEFVNKINSHGAEIIVTVGGDGIASYVATAIIRQKKSIGILGFPAGTANVGPIVRADHDSYSFAHKSEIDAIEVSCNGKVIGYGFNDVIIGWTFLGTVDGNCVNLKAHEMAKNGKAVEETDYDKPVVGNDFEICMNGKSKKFLQCALIKQICISTLHQDNLYGRTIMGGVAEAYGFEHPASIALLDKIATDARPETWGIKEFRTTSHLCFDEKDCVEIKGIANGACVIIDGNPFVLEKNKIDLRCIPNSVTVYGVGR